MTTGRKALVLGIAAAWVLAAPVMAAEPIAFAVAAQPLGAALTEIARTAGLEVMFPADAVAGRRAPAIHGRRTLEDALDQLLAGTGLTATIENGTIVVREGGEIVVTGTRIRGAAIASPLISISGADMRAAGHTTLTDVAAALPQNFGGGQTPGLGFLVPQSSGENIGSGTALNLRGLGQDATLTLLNGRRLSFGGNRQAIDISAIPVAAVERLEIVADGASALYGSDAVAGVANVILKRDYDGVTTSARFGASTDGGNAQQQFGLVAGTRWATGGLIATYDYGHQSAVLWRQRAYTAETNDGLTLYPELEHHSIVASGHQALGSDITLGLDALYNWRRDRRTYAVSESPAVPRYAVPGHVESLTIAPSLTVGAGRWSLAAAATYGFDRTHYGTDMIAAGVATPTLRACYCNTAWSAEVNADGPLFRLPAGDARLALGAGYRVNDFHAYRTVGPAQDVDVSQDAYYAFGEFSLPLVAPEQGLGLVHRLTLNAAVRYEKYPGIDSVATPRFGIVYAPTPDLDLKASWGRSFKAPTLWQQYSGQIVDLRPASTAGGTGLPASATVLSVFGGNPGLKPERASTWSVSAALHPEALPGTSIEISGFGIDYDERIVTPITQYARALSDPVFAEFIVENPSAADIAAAFADREFINRAGADYDPANVVAVIWNANVNAAWQKVRGVDVAARQRFDLGADTVLVLSGSATWMRSRQKISQTQPEMRLAGTVFNPPKFRARGGASLAAGTFDLSAFVNHIAGVDQTRIVPAERLHGMTTLDLSLLYRPAGGGLLGGLELSLSAMNAFNAKPDTFPPALILDAPYDSTNYSALGRVVSFGISKSW